MPQPPDLTRYIKNDPLTLHGEPPTLAAQEHELSLCRSEQEGRASTLPQSSLKSNDRDKGPILSAACTAAFIEAVDQGLGKLRQHLLRTFVECSAEFYRIDDSFPSTQPGRTESEHFVMPSKELSWEEESVNRISDAGKISRSSQADHVTQKSKELSWEEESATWGSKPSRNSHPDHIAMTGFCSLNGSVEGEQSTPFEQAHSNLTEATEVLTDPGLIDKREVNQCRWVRFVQLIVTLGRAQFQMLSCWIPSSEHVDDVSLVITNTMNQVGAQKQKIDEILHAWNVQQNKGLRTYKYVVGSFLSESETGVRKRNKFVLHPLSSKRIVWSLFGLVCIVYDAVLISLTVFDIGESGGLDMIDWALRVYWVLDIVVSFRTGFYVKARYEDAAPKIAKNYLSSWFAIDFVAVIPDWFITLLEESSDLGNYSQTFRYLKIFKMLRLVRMAKMASWVHSIMESLNSINLQLSIHILKYALLVIIWVHACGCLWYVIAKGQDDSWIARNEMSHLRLPVTYFISVQWAFAQLQGNTDINPAFTMLERAVSSLVIMLSIFVLAVFISNITNTLIQLQNAWEEKASQLRALQDYLHRHKVSPDLSETVRKYCAEKLKIEKKLRFGEDDVTNLLPKGMRRALLVEVRAGMIKARNPVLSALCRCHPNIFEKVCCDIVNPLFSGPDSLVYNYGEECGTTYFVVGGELMYEHVNNNAMGDLVRIIKGSSRHASDEKTRHASHFGSRMSASEEIPFRSSGVVTMRHEGSQTVHKTLLKERMETGTVINSTPLSSSQQLCEAALWTSWTHCGDLNAVGHSAFLIIEARNFQILVEHDPKLMRFGVGHAVRFCRVLNDFQNLSDLLTSNNILDELFQAGEIKDFSKQVSFMQP